MMDSACRTDAFCKKGGKEICKYVNKESCVQERRSPLKCESEYKLCANADSKNCAEVVEHLESAKECKEFGIAKMCQIERQCKACAKGPKICLEMLERVQENCAKKEDNKKLCKTKKNKRTKMNTGEEMMVITSESLLDQWKQCNVNEDMKKECMEKCAKKKPKEWCEQRCTQIAEECKELQQTKVLLLRFRFLLT